MEIKNSGWDTKVTINLSLLELQILYDAFCGATYENAKYHWDKRNKKIPYKKEDMNDLFVYINNNIGKVGGEN